MLENIVAKEESRSRYRRDETGYSLCHGKLGGDLKHLREKLGQQECENFGLMGGITGIGYASLCGVEETGKRLQVGR